MSIVICSKCRSKNRIEETSPVNRIAKCGKCGAVLNVTSRAQGATDNKPLIVTDGTFYGEVIRATGAPMLVDCWAPWCGPCRIVGPILDQLALEANGRYRIAKLNVDENPRIAAQYQIQSIPTMLIFKDGKLIDRLIGAQPKQAIAERLMRAA